MLLKCNEILIDLRDYQRHYGFLYSRFRQAQSDISKTQSYIMSIKNRQKQLPFCLKKMLLQT